VGPPPPRPTPDYVRGFAEIKDKEELSRQYPGMLHTIKSGFQSIMAIPLISKDEVIGTLILRSLKLDVYTEGDLRLAERVGSQIAGAIANAQLFLEQKRAEKELREVEEVLKETLEQLESRVRERTIELEETNIAMRVLLTKGEKDQKKMEENLQSNVNQLVLPFLSKLRVSPSNQERLTYLNILETNLNNIVSPFINQLSAAYKNLTPKELQIAELIRQGKGSKEIAGFFGVSVGTVTTHRNNIRKKLQLKSRDANLRSHLLSLIYK
jgi:DNA-binding CsgD family transcriptional regulator